MYAASEKWPHLSRTDLIRNVLTDAVKSWGNA
jgi:hypothetical protein